MRRWYRIPLTMALALGVASTASAQQGGQRQARGEGNGRQLDMMTFPRPIEAADNVWIEELTMLEVRDALKAGTTTALVLTGGIEENGPYLTTGKHNHVLEVMGEAIARKLGNTLVAPIVTIEPGNPERATSPGGIRLSQETFRAVLRDMATSLKAQGFTEIFFLGDSGSNQQLLARVAERLANEWRGQNVLVSHIREYYNYGDVLKYQNEVLGKVELDKDLDGYHDDYYISSIIATVDTNGIRMPERRKAGKFVINGVPLDPIEKTIANGKRIVEFRTDATVAAIKKAMTDAGR